MTSRLLIIRTAYPVAKRSFHVSSVRKVDSKATYATIAPEKTSSSSPPNITPPPTKEDKTVAKVEGKPLVADVQEKRDFHWSHPVYTREEYESIQVDHYHVLTDDRLAIMRLVHSANTSL